MWSKFLRLQDHRLSKSDRIFIVNALRLYGSQPQPLSIKQLFKEVKLSRETLKKSIQFLSQIEVLDLQGVSSDGTLLDDSTCSFSPCFIDQVKLLTAPEPLFEKAIRRLLFTEKKPSSEDYFLAILVAHCNFNFRVVKQNKDLNTIPTEISINDLLETTGLKKQTIYCYLNRLKSRNKIMVVGIGLKSKSISLFEGSGIHIKIIDINIFEHQASTLSIESYRHPYYTFENNLLRSIALKIYNSKDRIDQRERIQHALNKNHAIILNTLEKSVNHYYNVEKICLIIESFISIYIRTPEMIRRTLVGKDEDAFTRISKDDLCKDLEKTICNSNLSVNKKILEYSHSKKDERLIKT